jgi:sugar lactone lactonase YvrE
MPIRYALLPVLLFSVCLQAQNILTVAGNGTVGYSGDGNSALLAQLHTTYGVTTDAQGNIIIADQYNNCIRQVNSAGVISTIVGTAVAGISGDGGPATAAQVYAPQAVKFDAAGNLFFADYNNHRIRKVDTNGIITTVVGTGVLGFSGDGGSALLAQLNAPEGFAIDQVGNMYIADRGNARIRKVDTNGIITTIAGNGTNGFAGDGGPAWQAVLNYPVDGEIDAENNFIFCDAGNHKIRKIATDGTITTIAGNGLGGFAGDGGPATNAALLGPQGVTCDALGNIFIADTDNNRIRWVNPYGNISTLAGTGAAAYSGDGGPSTAAAVNYPRRVALNDQGELLICDAGNYRIRIIKGIPTSIAEQVTIRPISVFPNPSRGQFTMELELSGLVSIQVFDARGALVHSEAFTASGARSQRSMDLSALAKGSYTLQVQNSGGVVSQQVVVE